MVYYEHLTLHMSSENNIRKSYLMMMWALANASKFLGHLVHLNCFIQQCTIDTKHTIKAKYLIEASGDSLD